MTTKQALLKQFKENMPAWRSESVRYRYPRLVSHFIDYVGVKSTYTKADVLKFLNYIINSGMSKNYAIWSSYILKQFYEALGIQFPLRAGDLPKLEPGDVNAPIFSPNYVGSLIGAVKAKGTPMMKAYLALSTTYGLRRQELAGVSSRDMNDSIIRINTVKGRVVREHLIPEEIKPYLSYEFRPIHPQTITNLFIRIQRLAGVDHGDREGPHSIRRSLVTELQNAGVPAHFVFSFMGWKLSSRLGIMGEYTRPDPVLRDSRIYEKHPFLRFWVTTIPR